jgi:DNA replication protein DnaC
VSAEVLQERSETKNSDFVETIEVFREGLYRELEAQKERSRRTDIQLTLLENLESKNQRYRASFQANRASDGLAAGAKANLLNDQGSEIEVRIEQVDGAEVELSCAEAFKAKEYSLSLAPWFLFERLQEQLNTLSSEATDGQVQASLESFGLRQARSIPSLEFQHPALNDSQNRAIQTGLRQSSSRIWGPPGTGKTTTLAVLVSELASRGERVLLTSNTHAALDQVLEGLLKQEQLQEPIRVGKVIRMGRCHPDHRSCSLREVTRSLHEKLREKWERSEQRLITLRQRVNELQKPLRQLQIATGPSEQLSLFESAQPQGLPLDWLHKMFGETRGNAWSRTAPSRQCELLERHMNRLTVLRTAHGNRISDCRDVLAQRQQQTVNRACIVLCTLANITTSRWMEEEMFDNVIVEEAGMAVLPAFFVACSKATKRTVAVGDPRQLPSILTSRDSFVRHALGRNIFEVGKVPQTMLNTQYRMHPEIGDLVSHLAYEDRLISARSSEEFEEWTQRDPLEGGSVAGFDLQGASVCQKQPGSSSRFNDESAGVCLKLAQRAVDAGFDQVAIITPYRQQVRTLRRLLGDQLRDKVECDTVHRYQGKERDVVIIDLVDGEAFGPGTLIRDDRGSAAQLLNVALSRAKYKLFLVGELNYLCRQIPHSFAGRAITYLARQKKLFKVKV